MKLLVDIYKNYYLFWGCAQCLFLGSQRNFAFVGWFVIFVFEDITSTSNAAHACESLSKWLWMP